MTKTPIIKQPGERIGVRFEYGQPGGREVTSIIAADVTAAGRVAEVLPLSVAAQVHGSSYALITLEGGSIGELYVIEVLVGTDDGERVAQRQELLCLDLSFRVPDVALPTYLSIGEFVARAGLDLAIQLTDEAATGAIDAERLEAALLDAQGLIDSYLGQRYAVPLAAPVPPPIPTLTYDLAFARLWRGELPDGAARAHAQALQALRDLAAGRAVLSLDAPPSPLASATVMFRGHDRLFSRDTMAGC